MRRNTVTKLRSKHSVRRKALQAHRKGAVAKVDHVVLRGAATARRIAETRRDAELDGEIERARRLTRVEIEFVVGENPAESLIRRRRRCPAALRLAVVENLIAATDASGCRGDGAIPRARGVRLTGFAQTIPTDSAVEDVDDCEVLHELGRPGGYPRGDALIGVVHVLGCHRTSCGERVIQRGVYGRG